jgi:RNA polymerase sigma factor (sigma-70 family)
LLSDTDEQLMAAVQSGDSSALGVLFTRHHSAVYRYFLRMSGSATLSEDLTQDVFLRVLRKSETWQRDARFASWMYRIAHNAFIDHTRKNKWEIAMPEKLDTAAPATRQLEQAEEHALLRRALMAMPPDKRELLVLSRFQGLKYEQIGELLGVETNTVKVRVFRALGQLREIYERMSGHPGLSIAGGRS